MKEFLMKNSVLKAVSVILAILLWFYVIIIVDPLITITIEDVPVIYKDKPSNDLAIIDDNMTQFVDVEIKATRKEISKINKDKILATVDCKNVTKEGSNSVKVEITPYDQKVEPIYVEIVADKIEEKTVGVEVLTKGELAEGYAFDGAFGFEKNVNIRGAEYYLNLIRNVVLEVETDGMNSDAEKEISIAFVDNNGKKIDKSESIYRNVEVKNVSKVTYSQTADNFSLRVKCKVKKKHTVPVEVDLGDLWSWYEVADIKYGDVSVKEGITLLLENEDAAVEKIATKPISIDSNAVEANFMTVNVELIIPNGVRLQEENRKTVEVELKKKELQEVNPVEENNSQQN